MHELSLCQQLASAVSRAAGSREVETVHVDLGALRQAVPDAMCFAWEFVVRGTALDGSRLVLRELPAVIRCSQCGARARLGPELGFDCQTCGSPETSVVSGEQFMLRAVDVRTGPGPTNDEEPAGRAPTRRGEDDGPIPSPR